MDKFSKSIQHSTTSNGQPSSNLQQRVVRRTAGHIVLHFFPDLLDTGINHTRTGFLVGMDECYDKRFCPNKGKALVMEEDIGHMHDSQLIVNLKVFQLTW